jgi:hypothetical protein
MASEDRKHAALIVVREMKEAVPLTKWDEITARIGGHVWNRGRTRAVGVLGHWLKTKYPGYERPSSSHKAGAGSGWKKLVPSRQGAGGDFQR